MEQRGTHLTPDPFWVYNKLTGGMPLNQGAGFGLIKFDESDLKQKFKQKTVI